MDNLHRDANRDRGNGEQLSMEESDGAVIAGSLETPGAFGVIFDRHGSTLLRFLARRVDPAEAEDLVRSLAPDGVETFYPPHTKQQTAHLLALCEELDMVPTASSDFHGPTHKTFAEFGAYDTYGLGEPQVPANP